jgi:very-short-patch-repair endonuclease
MEPKIHKPPTDERLLGFARRMRSEPTDAENKLWWLLRSRKLGGFKFRRQVPLGNYILDFYCHEARLVVEADGGQHDDPTGQSYDARRTVYLQSQGIRVLRFWDNEVLTQTEAVREMIYRELTQEVPGRIVATSASPHPNPLPEGEGVNPASSH